MAKHTTIVSRRMMTSLLLLGVGFVGGPAWADTITDGFFVTVGDSYTGSYHSHGARRGNHQSWVEQLDAHYSASSFQNLGISGTTTLTAQMTGDSHEQLADTLGAIHGNGAGVVVIGLGVNDFSSIFESNTAMTQQQADAVADAAFNNLRALVDAVLDPTTGNADARIVISNSVDRTHWAISTTSAFDLNRDVTSAAIQRYNQLVADEFSTNRGLAVVDQYQLLEDMLAGDPADSNFGAGPNGELFIAGQQIGIDPFNAIHLDGSGISRQPSDHLWADGAHPGSVFQGLYANVVLAALDETYGLDAGVEGMLTIDEIFLGVNNLNPSDGVLLTASDANYSFDYYNYIVPEPGSAVALLVMAGLLGRRRRCGSSRVFSA